MGGMKASCLGPDQCCQMYSTVIIVFVHYFYPLYDQNTRRTIISANLVALKQPFRLCTIISSQKTQKSDNFEVLLIVQLFSICQHWPWCTLTQALTLTSASLCLHYRLACLLATAQDSGLDLTIAARWAASKQTPH